MKILYFLDKPNLFGSELHTLDLFNFFSEKEDVNLICFDYGDLLDRISSNKYVVIKASWFSIFLKSFNVFRLVWMFKPSLIHAHQPKAAFVGAIIGSLIRVPVVVTVHSTPEDLSAAHRGYFKSKLVKVFHTVIEGVSLSLANAVIYVNEEMYKKTHYQEKAYLITNWLRPTFKIKEKKIMGVGPIRFITVCSFTNAKGIDLLIDFFDKLAMNNVDFISDIYGGDQRQLPEQLKERFKNNDHVNIKGYVSNLEDVYSEYDFYVLFSRYETFGLSYLEAMSQGLPIICLKLNSLEYLIPEGNILVNTVDEGVYQLKSFLENDVYRIVSLENIKKSKYFLSTEKINEIREIYERLGL